MINFCLDRIIPALALVIKKHKHNFSNVVTQLRFWNPFSYISELIKIYSNVLHIKEKQASLQLSSTCQDKEKVLSKDWTLFDQNGDLRKDV